MLEHVFRAQRTGFCTRAAPEQWRHRIKKLGNKQVLPAHAVIQSC